MISVDVCGNLVAIDGILMGFKRIEMGFYDGLLNDIDGISIPILVDIGDCSRYL